MSSFLSAGGGEIPRFSRHNRAEQYAIRHLTASLHTVKKIYRSTGILFALNLYFLDIPHLNVLVQKCSPASRNRAVARPLTTQALNSLSKES